MHHQHHTQVKIQNNRVVGRRDFLKSVSLASAASGILGWPDVLSLHAGELRKRGKACIVLWMAGGPSQFETFSPKPKHRNGGETAAIRTNVTGIHYSENLPCLAKVADRLAVIRSMTSKEGSHNRGTALLHTGYLPTANIKYPGIGAIVSQQTEPLDCELPRVVQIGASSKSLFNSGGLLGVGYDPFVVSNPDQMPSNSQLKSSESRYLRRIELMKNLGVEFAGRDGKQIARDHAEVYQQSSKMILSPQMTAFDLEEESDSMRAAYGRTQFGSACLLARRLVETGVTCVELVCDGWDSHNDNFKRHRKKTQEIDQPFAQLVADLESRGLLDSTLLVWMGEFGRTPKINARGGRDHYPSAFNVALSGCGVRGGQVIGKTDTGGVEIVDRPVSVSDLFQTIYHCLDIDTEHENTSRIGRDVKVIEDGQVIQELIA